MIVTRDFPDLPPGPETERNAGFRQRFFSRWGRENSVFVAATRRVQYGPLATALSFKAVLEGSAAFTLGRRRLLLEPGFFLLVNAGDEYSVAIDSPRPVQCFTVHFKPELASDVALHQGLGWRAALEPGAKTAQPPLLRETLNPLEPHLQQWVQRVAHSVRNGQPEAMALESEFIGLLQTLLQRESRRHREVLAAMPSVRASTRQELLRRVDWAADHMLSAYAEPLTLDDIAAAARLSKFHLLRAFHQVRGCTPHQFLRARRAQVAQRLLADHRLGLDAVAAAAGFGSRWTLQRALRLHCGASGAQLRGAQHV